MRCKIGFIVTFVSWSFLSLAAQQVRTSYDHTYDFSSVKTFTVRIVPAWGNPAIEKYVKELVATQLQYKGWAQAPDVSSADVMVVVKGSVETIRSVEAYYSGGIMGAGLSSSPPGVLSDRVVEQKLAQGNVNIFDEKTETLIFSGIAVAEISSRDKKNEKKIRKGIRKVFKDFPPKAGA
jgi:hypothetical protein